MAAMAGLASLGKGLGSMKGGSLVITGYLDMGNIKTGLKDIGDKLKETRAPAKEAKGDFEGLASTLTGILGPIGKIGAAVVSATIGLAALGPAVAPALARMQVSFFELTRGLSEALQPAFEKFADLFEGFVQWVDSPEGKGVLQALDTIIVSIGNGLQSAGKFAAAAATEIGKITQSVTVTFDAVFGKGAGAQLAQYMVEHGAFPAAAALMGFYVGGPVGAVIAGGAALGVQEAGNLMTAKEQGDVAAAQNAGGLTGVVAGGATGALLGTFVFPAVGTLVGGIIGAIAGGLFGWGATPTLAGMNTPAAAQANTSSNPYMYMDTSSSLATTSGGGGAGWYDGYSTERVYEKEQLDWNGFVVRNK